MINRFSVEQRRRWGPVTTTWTSKIAHRCASGVGWLGSPKGLIYSDIFLETGNITHDIPKFVRLMDKAAEISKRAAAKLDKEIGYMIADDNAAHLDPKP